MMAAGAINEDLLNDLRLKFQRTFSSSKNEENFYNYTLLCSGSEARANREKSFIDNTIPDSRRSLVHQTWDDPSKRENKCPRWAPIVDKSGAMESLEIAENTPVGTRVYMLSAIDPELKPLFYYVRKAEKEPANEPLIFNITTARTNKGEWIGEVYLSRPVDYETKSSYEYLTYAYDGENLIEKYSIVTITDVDDEKPQINRTHSNYNALAKRFEFKVYENVSIGEVINAEQAINFTDVDTQLSQLRLKLSQSESSGMLNSPFSIGYSGLLRTITNLDYETQSEYLLNLEVKVI
jgi:hypothetical protein